MIARHTGQAGVVAAMATIALAIALLPLIFGGTLVVGLIIATVVAVRPELGLVLLAIAPSVGSIAALRAVGSLPAGPTEAAVGLVGGSFLVAMLTRRRHLELGPLFWPMLGFVAAGALSASTALDKAAAIKELLRWVELMVVYVVAFNLTRDYRWARIIIVAIFLLGIAQALLGVVQFVGQIGPPSFALGRFLRAYGTFGQPNPYAGYLGTILPLAITLSLFWREEADARLRILAVVSTFLVAGALLASFSRGSWLGHGVAIVAMAALVSRRVLTGLMVVGVVVLLSYALGAIELVPTAISARLATTMAYFHIFDARDVWPDPANWSIVQRMAHWQAAWWMFLDYPFLGVGPGGYVSSYGDYAILPFWREPLGHAHSIYLNIAAEFGLVGLVAYLAMVASWFWVALATIIRIKKNKRYGLRWGVALGSFGVLVVAAIHNAFDNLYVQGMVVQVGLVLGLMASAATQRTAWEWSTPPGEIRRETGDAECALE